MKQDTCKYFRLFLCLLLFHTHVFSQPSSLHFRHLTTSDGLSGNSVNAICQDKPGFLWFATQSGLNRYDGKHITVFTHLYTDTNSIANNICLGLCVDSSDNIWVRSPYSISCFNKRSGKFINYFYKEETGKIVATPGVFSGMMTLNNGHILISSSVYGFLEADSIHHRLVQKHFTNIPSTIDRKSEFVCTSGAIGYRTDSAIYVSVDDGGHFKKAISVDQLPADLAISMLGLASVKGTVCGFGDIRGEASSLLVEADIATGKVTIGKFHTSFFMALSMYDDGTYWAGFWGSGLLEYDRRTGHYVRYIHYKNDPGTISNDLIKTIFTDRDKNLWIGAGNGIDFCNPEKDRVFMINKNEEGYEKLDISDIETMAEDSSGKIWIGLLDYNSGASNGLVRFDPLTFKYNRYLKPGSKFAGVWHILPEGDYLLLSLQNGLFQFNLKNARLTKEFSCKLPAEIVNFDRGLTIVKKDHLGNYWFGLWRKGLIKFNNATRETVHFNIHANDPACRLSDDLVYNMTVDDNNNIWMTNLINNVVEFINNKTNEVTHIPVIINGQPFTDKIQCIMSDHFGKIWIGSGGGGLVIYDIAKHHFHLLSTADGLPDDAVHGLQVDDKNRLWVLCSTGVVWIDLPGGQVHSIDKNILRFSDINGDEPLMITRDGHIYIGSANSFFFFRPNDVLLSEKVDQPIPVSFQRLNKDEYVSPYQREIKIYPGEDNVSIRFVSINMAHGDEVNYSYYLKGYDDLWQEAGKEGIAKFTKLPKGNYELRMRATFRGTKWDGKYSSIILIVVPAFYQAWWFKVIIFIMAAAFIGWFIYYISTRRLRKKVELLRQQQQINNLRNRIANDIHDEIGAGLTRISIRSELMKQDQDATKNDYLEVLQNINHQSHELVNSLGEIVWTINPQHDRLDSMLAYFRQYIHQFMEGLPVQYAIHFPDCISDEAIHPDLKRNLFLILKEALNNAIKHSKAEMIEITLEINQRHYALMVSDNGEGIHVSAMDKFGNGIKGMKNRAALIRASIEIRSVPGRGTTVSTEGSFYGPL